MKVTLWQQFSSNHSSHFHIVGVFDTAEAAQKAADEIKEVLKQIEDWHNDNPEKSERLGKRWGTEGYPLALSEIEEQLAKQYGVKWDCGIEWYNVTEIRLIFNHVLHLTTRHQTTASPEPLVQIVDRLGGYGLVAGENGDYQYGTIEVHLSCTAPTIVVAQAIAKEKNSDDDEIFERATNYDTKLNFHWDWENSIWQLDKLVQELTDRGCTNFEYSFSGTRTIGTDRYKLVDKNEGEKS